MTYAMIDIETVDNKPTSAIVQIGAANNLGATFKVNIILEDAMRHGTVGAGTLKWWLQQSEKARISVFSEGAFMGLKEALESLNDWLECNNVEHIWSHATFDMPILMNAFNSVELKPSWDFRKLRDLRTIEHFYGDNILWEQRGGVHHDALDDALYQMKHLDKMMAIHSTKGE